MSKTNQDPGLSWGKMDRPASADSPSVGLPVSVCAYGTIQVENKCEMDWFECGIVFFGPFEAGRSFLVL